MRDEIANLVHPVFTYALRLKERLERGETPDYATEQQALKGLLLSDREARRWSDFGGDEGGVDQSMIGATRTTSRRGTDHFLGIRYALACWLDETFILDSPWESKWNEQKMEQSLYGTNDRAWSFWEQARRAETRPGSDALEVFFLCVMLGFRGDLRDESDKLQAWVDAAQGRIAKSQGQEWPVPAELDPTTYVPPLRGREQLQRMVVAGGIVLLIVVPFVAFFVVHQLGQ